MEFKLKGKKKGGVRKEVTELFSETANEEENSKELDDAKAAELEKLGADQADRGDFTAALLSFQQCLHLQPTNYKVLEMQAQIYLETDHVMLALKAAETALHHQPNWKDGMHTLARCQREIGEVYLSLETYDKVIQLYSQEKPNHHNTDKTCDSNNESTNLSSTDDPCTPPEILAERQEVAVLVEQLEEKKKVQLVALADSSASSDPSASSTSTRSEAEMEVRRCIYHLCHRGHALPIPRPCHHNSSSVTSEHSQASAVCSSHGNDSSRVEDLGSVSELG